MQWRMKKYEELGVGCISCRRIFQMYITVRYVAKACLRYGEHRRATYGRVRSDDIRQRRLYPVTCCRCDRAKVTALVAARQPTLQLPI